jgi:hypothetical protein
MTSENALKNAKPPASPRFEDHQWVILYFPRDQDHDDTPIRLIRQRDARPHGPWTEEDQPWDYAHWPTEEEAARWARETMARLHPECTYTTVDWAACLMWHA